MAMTRRELMGNSLALGTMSLVFRLDPARRLSGGVSESDVLAFTHVTVIDATGRPALPEQTVLVKGDRIEAIGKFGKLDLPGDWAAECQKVMFSPSHMSLSSTRPGGPLCQSKPSLLEATALRRLRNLRS